jgi:hypothetical protein
MTTRTLELNLRARADTKGLESLIKGTEALSSAMRRTGAAFDEANADARRLVQAYGQLSQEEREQVASASRLAAAVSQAAAARERSAAAASNAAAAESRSLAAQQQAEGAALRTAAAQERLTAAQAGAATSVSRAAAAEEKLAQERQRTFQATTKSEKAELDVAKAREQLRAATARAEAAEQRLTQTRKSSGLAADIVKQQFAALVTGGSILIAGRQLLEFGKSSISAASDAEEASAKFNQVFRSLAEGVRDDLEIMADANRRSIYDLVSFASTLQDTFVPLGFAREEAAALSTTITQLGIDIAAFSNKADSEVIDNLTSAIVGNHEAVRSYGIVLTETVLKQELARMGALELTGAALEMAKAQARVNIIMRASADAQGAAVREADSYANVLKAFDAATQELKVSIGEGLLPVMTDLALVAIDVVEALGSDYARELLAAEEANRKAGASARELTDDLKAVIDTVRESGSWFDKLRLSQGNIGNEKEIENLLAGIARGSESVDEFKQRLDELGLSATYLVEDGGMWDIGESADELAEQFYATARAAPVLEQALADLAEMEAVYLAERKKIFEADAAFQSDNIAPAWVSDEKTKQAMDAWGAWAEDLGAVTEATKAAAAAQLEWNAAFGEAFDAAPVDDLIKAQGDLAAASGEWRTATIDNSREIADVQGQLAADLTRDQEAALRTQLKDLDDFSAEYMAIIRQLEGDLSDTQRLDLLDQLGSLEGRQGEATRVYTGDIEAAEEAQAAIIEANKAIQDSYYERAYNSIAARLIEEGNFAAMAEIAVGLGIMTQEEANLRLEYAQTTAAIDTLTASTAFYGLTAEQQTGAIKSLAAGIYDTADAALKAQENLKAASDFYSTAPDSTAISNYYTNLANQAAPDEGITTVVSVSIDPTAQREFTGFRDELEDYDDAIYETQIDANAQEAIDDFEKMGTQLGDLTRNAWVIKVRYETEGTAPGTPSTTPGGAPGGGGGGAVSASYQPNGTSPYVDLTVNNYAPGDVSRAAREGVLAAFRSLA